MFWLKDKTVLVIGGTGSLGKRHSNLRHKHTGLKRLVHVRFGSSPCGRASASFV